MSSPTIKGLLYDLPARRKFPAKLVVRDGRIARIEPMVVSPGELRKLPLLLPPFVDAHVHVESSLLSPVEFSRLVLPHGTGAVVSDPHEIANVCGVEGIEWMLKSAALTPLKIRFGVPSCVPALGGDFETSGAVLDADAVASLLAREEFSYLAEMMNFPGVLAGDAQVLNKIAAAQKLGKPVDGHAPLLRGDDARRYALAGPSTDHECSRLPEALDKIAAGMKILIREGSAACNYEALHPLLRTHPERVMFCCDDLHPDLAELRHIDEHVRRSCELGYDEFDVLRAATLNPVKHYGIPLGMLQEGDSADFLVVTGPLAKLQVKETWLAGERVAHDGECLLQDVDSISPVNNFKSRTLSESDFQIQAQTSTIRVIEVEDGQLLTGESRAELPISDGFLQSDPRQDILKLVVINRYDASKAPAIGFVRGFGLKRGALASSVGHDCHNIAIVAVDDRSLVRAANEVMRCQGALVACDSHHMLSLPLPVAGLMSLDAGKEVAREYRELNRFAQELGCRLRTGFMSLSFLPLVVIPELKLSDKGLVNVRRMERTELFV